MNTEPIILIGLAVLLAGASITGNFTSNAIIGFQTHNSGVAFPLFTAGQKFYLEDSLDKVRQTLTDDQLPQVLEDGEFSGNVHAYYTQLINLGSSKLQYGKYPNSDYDPAVAFALATVPSKPVYNASVTFSNNVDLTSPKSKGKKITLFGKDFVIGNETNNAELVLYDSSNRKMILRNGLPVEVGNHGEIVDGTQVEFTGNVSSLTRLVIQVAAKDTDNDAIAEGADFIDPVFGTWALDFRNMSFPEYSSSREKFTIRNSGNDKMTLIMTESRGYAKKIGWLLSDTRGNSMLADSIGKIKSIEMTPISKYDSVILGNREEGRFIRVKSIVNFSRGFVEDKVVLTDVFSGEEYTATITSEGAGYFIITGRTYGVHYFANSLAPNSASHIRVNYPDSADNGLVIYPVIESSGHAQVAFYEPLVIDLSDYDGKGSDVSNLMFPNGNGYTYVTVILAGDSFLVNNATVSASMNATIQVGHLSYVFTLSSENITKVFLQGVSGSPIPRPSIVLFESKNPFEGEGYYALIVKSEGDGNRFNGVGVEDVETTWGNDSVFDEIGLESNPNLFKSMDRWGTIVTTDRTNNDQYAAGISYNREQSYAGIYAVELL